MSVKLHAETVIQLAVTYIKLLFLTQQSSHLMISIRILLKSLDLGIEENVALYQIRILIVKYILY